MGTDPSIGDWQWDAMEQLPPAERISYITDRLAADTKNKTTNVGVAILALQNLAEEMQKEKTAATDLDAAIREKLAVDQDSYYFEYDCEMIQDAVLAGLELHAAGYPGNEVEYEDREEPAYDRNGVVIGSIMVKGDPVPPYWCNTCQEMAPCPAVKAVAQGLGIEVEA